jgi:sterol desaturase/sphingolipid hydroxylase (fatty acid hydroxylase superfamily)
MDFLLQSYLIRFEWYRSLDAAMATALGKWASYIQILILFSTLLIALELCWLYAFRKERVSLKEAAANIIVHFSKASVRVLTLFFACTYLAQFAPWHFHRNLLTFFVCLALTDLFFWVIHYLSHKVRLFWVIHSIHHSGHHYNLSLGIRQVDSAFFIAFYSLLAVVGFDPAFIIISHFIVHHYQLYLHTELIDQIPWLEGVLGTPASHRAHHGSIEECLDKNFAAVFSIWDHLFGTYVSEKDIAKKGPIPYGTVEPFHSYNPLWIIAFGFVGLYRDFRKAKGLDEKWRVLWSMTPEELERESESEEDVALLDYGRDSSLSSMN